MPVDFLLPPRAKMITLAQVARMTKDQAETTFAAIRWSEPKGDRLDCLWRALHNTAPIPDLRSLRFAAMTRPED